jgi:hypothetical protein
MMFADDERIVPLPLTGQGAKVEDAQVNLFRENFAYGCEQYYRAGFEKCRKDWDVSSYDSVDVPFEKRWSSFKCNRDMGREAILESLVNPNNEPFILVHDECQWGRMPFRHRTDMKVIRVEPIRTQTWSDSLVDWCGLIEKATEIHCVDSSFIHLCTSMGATGWFHDFGRDDSWGGHFALPSSWEKIREVRYAG